MLFSKVRRVSAFTLIELLTVIAIIGILAAIIIPTVGKVRETAKFANSLSNVRQVTQAHMTYANDNKGNLPWIVDTSLGVNAWWQMQILPYVSPISVTSYADANKLAGARPPGVFADPFSDALVPTGSAQFQNTEYGRNSLVAKSATDTTAVLRNKRNIAQIPEAARTLMITACDITGPEVGWWNVPDRVKTLGKAPAGYFDGHATTLKYSDMVDTTQRKIWDPNQ